MSAIDRSSHLFWHSSSAQYIIIFILALTLRAAPEFLSGIYPVGFDLLAGYLPALVALPDVSPMKLFGWFWSPLAIFVLWFSWMLTGVDLYLFLKVAGPVFYGLFVLSFYYMLWKGLGWSGRKSFVTALLFLLQPAVLRTGWDQLREELGFVFLFVLLGRVNCDVVGSVGKKPLTVVVLSVLVVLSHQLAAVLLFVVVFWQLVDGLVKKSGLFLRGLVGFLPSALVFVWQLYGQFVCPNFSDHFAPIQLPLGSDIFGFTNYFLSDPRFLGGDYWKVLSYVGSLSLYVVVPLVLFAWRGFFWNRVFTPMLVWLCITTYSIVVFPWFAFSYYWWWILLLPIPLTVYVGHGLEKLGVFSSAKRLRVAVIALIMLGIVAFGYATSIIPIGYPYAYYYIPSGLVESSVPYEDIPNINKAFEWLNQNASTNSTIIVPEKFQGMAYIKLRKDIKICIAPSLLNLTDVVRVIELDSRMIYAVYYFDEIGDHENESISVLSIIRNLRVIQLNRNGY